MGAKSRAPSPLAMILFVLREYVQNADFLFRLNEDFDAAAAPAAAHSDSANLGIVVAMPSASGDWISRRSLADLVRKRLLERVIPAVKAWMAENLSKSTQTKAVSIAISEDVPRPLIEAVLEPIRNVWTKKNNSSVSKKVSFDDAWFQLIGRRCPLPIRVQDRYDAFTTGIRIDKYELDVDKAVPLTVVEPAKGGLVLKFAVLGYILVGKERFLKIGGTAEKRQAEIIRRDRYKNNHSKNKMRS